MEHRTRLESELATADPILLEAVFTALREIGTGPATGVLVKRVKSSGKNDYVTDADPRAQAVYERAVQERFTGWGFVGEEGDVRIPCTIPGEDVWLCVDGLDGTSSFVAGDLAGVTSMSALVRNGQVIAAYVGSLIDGTVIGFGPNNQEVRRWHPGGRVETLTIDPARPLSAQTLFVRGHPSRFSPGVREIAGLAPGSKSRFEDLDVFGIGVGAEMGRVWRGFTGAAVYRARKNHPWDLLPIYGISRQLGFVYLGFDPGPDLRLSPIAVPVEKITRHIPVDHLVVHVSRLEEIDGWMRQG